MTLDAATSNDSKYVRAQLFVHVECKPGRRKKGLKGLASYPTHINDMAARHCYCSNLQTFVPSA
eukprot:498476-Pelagomonas_calceolata.AAC.3